MIFFTTLLKMIISLILVLFITSQTLGQESVDLSNDNKSFWESILELNVLIPILLTFVISLFIFIYIFKNCTRERSESFINSMNSVTKFFSSLEVFKKKSTVISNYVDNKKTPNLSFK
mgnify:CR=1 FL=1